MAKKKAVSAKPETSAKSSQSFEQSLAEIETIVTELESGDLDLTSSLDRYELGVRRLKECHAILDSAEQKVSVLSGFDVDGNPITETMPETQFRSAGNSAGDANAGSAKNRVRNDSGTKPSKSAGDPDESSVDDATGLF